MNKLTNAKKVYNYIVINGCITTREMVAKLNILHPSNTISNMRKSGIKLITKFEYSKNGKKYAAFYLNKGKK